MAARRIELVDALRAFALFGILQVNVQSFVWGAGDPLGYFVQPPSPGETAVYLAIATFVSGKFIAIFSFLFGVGFALQMKSRRNAPAGSYRRRIAFLFAIGCAHGVLLYYGDILAFYAICGAVLALLYARARVRVVARAAGRWWLAFIGVTLALGVMFEAARFAFGPEGDPSRIPPEALHRLAVYATTGYWSQLPLRVSDFVDVLASIVVAGTPFVMALFTLGAVAGRLGWLARPDRHRRVWRAATWIGAAALPLAGIGAWINHDAMVNRPGDPTMLGYTLMQFGTPVAALYVALIVRNRARAPVAAAIRWLAPAGRMPLTNYLLQSVLMGVLLSGWGFGLGAKLSRVELAALALAIVALQVVASRAWIARRAQGPVERLWRRVTYGRAAA